LDNESQKMFGLPSLSYPNNIGGNLQNVLVHVDTQSIIILHTTTNDICYIVPSFSFVCLLSVMIYKCMWWHSMYYLAHDFGSNINGNLTYVNWMDDGFVLEICT